MKRLHPVILLFCLGFVTKIYSQTYVNVITTACPFLRIVPDARSGGMGESGVADTPDVNSIYHNTAKLGFAKKKFGVEGSYVPWLRTLVPNINLMQFSAYVKSDSLSAFTFSARYFSYGSVIYSNASGVIGQYRPFEYAIDAGYMRRIAKYWSVGMNYKFIHSDLTNGMALANQNTFPGQAIAFDLSGYYYDRDRVKIFHYPCTMMMGASLSNIGTKIKYTDTAAGDFLPANLSIGQGFEISIGDHKISFTYQASKLLVPTPPVYVFDTNGNLIQTSPGHYLVASGKDPNVSVPKGMLQSFNDAPHGKEEELQEISYQFGFEYWYANVFAVRAGYFYEAPEKGNRQFFTLGAGVRSNFGAIDFAYLIPTNGQRSPLEHTFRFSLLFEFDHFKKR